MRLPLVTTEAASQLAAAASQPRQRGLEAAVSTATDLRADATSTQLPSLSRQPPSHTHKIAKQSPFAKKKNSALTFSVKRFKLAHTIQTPHGYKHIDLERRGWGKYLESRPCIEELSARF